MSKKNENKQDGNHFDLKDTFIARAIYWFKSLSIIKHILIVYLFITLLGSLMLFTPQATASGAKHDFLDSLFTAASAFSDTGLATSNTAETWSMFGQAIIAILILIGGIGWFAMKVYLFNILFGRPITYATRTALAAERGSGVIGSTRRLIKVSVTIMFIIIIIFSVILTIYFYNQGGQMGGYDTDNWSGVATPKNGVTTVGWNSSFLGRSSAGDLGLSIRYGIFHSISAINNAGFDIIGGHSIAGFYHNYGLQIIFIMLFVLGGVGYPVIFDIYLFAKAKYRKERFQWSLFTKVSMWAYVLITVFGVAIVFLIEGTAHDTTSIVPGGPTVPSFWHDKYNGTTGDKTMALIFNTMSTRNAGFSTIKMGQLSRGTLIVYVAMMFMGSAPSSTAGGIRTTTVAIIFMGIFAKMRNRDKVQAFGKRIPTETVNRSYVVTVTAFILVIFSTLIVANSLASNGGLANSDWTKWDPSYVIPPHGGSGVGTVAQVVFKKYDFTEAMFEVGSAFGTTGLSVGMTGYLSTWSQLTLIIVMFIGQLGISSSILVWGKRKSSSKHYSYTKEDISTG